MRTDTASLLKHRASRIVLEAHLKLESLGLKGGLPTVNLRGDKHLPPCVYQPRTNAIAMSLPQISKVPPSTLTKMLLDAMASCGCNRLYQAKMWSWNTSQNKARLFAPALDMPEGPKWRSIRSEL